MHQVKVVAQALHHQHTVPLQVLLMHRTVQAEATHEVQMVRRVQMVLPVLTIWLMVLAAHKSQVK